MTHTILWKRSIGLTIALAAAVLPAAQEPGEKPHPDLPEGFAQILPRGRIAAVDSPQFVSAAQAEIPDEAWVLGVVVGGEARAYSLNLLNRHEVVNDSAAGKNFAAVW